MDLSTLILLLGGGFAAGTVNALAGGGTIFTFSALIAAGLPPIIANATSAVSVLPGQIASTLTYRSELRAVARRLIPFIIASALGGTAGGVLLLATDPSVFRVLIPWLIFFATVLFALSPQIAGVGERLAARRAAGSGPGPSATALQGAVAIYGGYFGAGMGIMMLATLSLTEGRDFHRLNAAKNVLACVMQGLAVIVFVVSGAVDWPSVFVVACASIAGGWASVRIGKLIPQQAIRWGVIVTGLALSSWYAFG